jgi:hypothetical protein
MEWSRKGGTLGIHGSAVNATMRKRTQGASSWRLLALAKADSLNSNWGMVEDSVAGSR